MAENSSLSDFMAQNLNLHNLQPNIDPASLTRDVTDNVRISFLLVPHVYRVLPNVPPLSSYFYYIQPGENLTQSFLENYPPVSALTLANEVSALQLPNAEQNTSTEEDAILNDLECIIERDSPIPQDIPEDKPQDIPQDNSQDIPPSTSSGPSTSSLPSTSFSK